MDHDRAALDAFLEEAGVDGFLIDAASDDSDQLYLSGFSAPDPFHTLYDGEVHLLVSSLEYGRAKSESRAVSVDRHVDHDMPALVEEHGRLTGGRRVLVSFLEDRGVESVAVPARFPLATADGLRERGIEVRTPDTPPIGRGGTNVIEDIRASKTGAEIDHVRTAQTANEAAMSAAEALLDAATVEDGTLHHDGDPLTSERVKEEIEVTLLRNGCALDETIVACGADAADPHDRGSGPLTADEPIIIDIFPQDKSSKYHADMTRTFLKGEPSDEIQRWYDLTAAAKRAALDAVEPGATGTAVHDAVCDVYEDAGEPTLRSDETTETGFIHNTGHGVGLDVHEQPLVGPGGDELEPGHVITVEPGLYHPAVGGIRIEDIVVVTEDGYENLTDYPEALVL
ncbi:M24 family metallopeptidase [Halorientalis sp.]|uniref:M24 family metallopeptidase n=1 Tax=Halorientalis sp. TaxID=1931229 RepID=UPI0026315DA2|nr:Xaa-Pro peptidase family protein [Halorientalis sp.]